MEKVHKLPHGESVGIGMMAAANLSAQKGYLADAQVAQLANLLESLKLPTRMAVDGTKVIDALRHDKKRENDTVHFVLLRRLGEAVVEQLPLSELEAVIHELF